MPACSIEGSCRGAPTRGSPVLPLRLSMVGRGGNVRRAGSAADTPAASAVAPVRATCMDLPIVLAEVGHLSGGPMRGHAAPGRLALPGGDGPSARVTRGMPALRARVEEAAATANECLEWCRSAHGPAKPPQRTWARPPHCSAKRAAWTYNNAPIDSGRRTRQPTSLYGETEVARRSRTPASDHRPGDYRTASSAVRPGSVHHAARTCPLTTLTAIGDSGAGAGPPVTLPSASYVAPCQRRSAHSGEHQVQPGGCGGRACPTAPRGCNRLPVAARPTPCVPR